jgi:hypothetical protein
VAAVAASAASAASTTKQLTFFFNPSVISAAFGYSQFVR